MLAGDAAAVAFRNSTFSGNRVDAAAAAPPPPAVPAGPAVYGGAAAALRFDACLFAGNVAAATAGAAVALQSADGGGGVYSRGGAAVTVWRVDTGTAVPALAFDSAPSGMFPELADLSSLQAVRPSLPRQCRAASDASRALSSRRPMKGTPTAPCVARALASQRDVCV